MKRMAIAAMAVALTGCSGGDGGPGMVAAKACEAFAITKLDGKPYTLDLKALAQSMKPEADLQALSAPIVVEPGSTNEAKETLDCKVRMSPDGSKADVIGLNFVF